MKQRLDQALAQRQLTSSRSQAESYIRLGLVSVNGEVITRSSHQVSNADKLVINATEQYVSRAGLKLASVANKLKIDFKDKIVLDVGSSTGGFSDYSLKHGASHVIAIDVGTNQLHKDLRENSRIELHEGTDIRDVEKLSSPVDLILVDVSFISLKQILPKLLSLSSENTQIVVMFKPQFESGANLKNKGVIKNDKIRRDLLADFENWLKRNSFFIKAQADSEVSGAKGNLERFYLLKKEQR